MHSGKLAMVAMVNPESKVELVNLRGTEMLFSLDATGYLMHEFKKALLKRES